MRKIEGMAGKEDTIPLVQTGGSSFHDRGQWFTVTVLGSHNTDP